MIFLVEYDRPRGQIVSLESFRDTDRVKAQRTRLKRELELNRQTIEREVVLLEAESIEALRRTHQRYFDTLGEIATSTNDRTKRRRA